MKAVEDIALNHYKILEDFARAWMSSSIIANGYDAEAFASAVNHLCLCKQEADYRDENPCTRYWYEWKQQNRDKIIMALELAKSAESPYTIFEHIEEALELLR